MIGKKKNIFRCRKCNSIDNKINRLTENTVAAELWRDLPPDEKKNFRAEKAELEQAALKDALTVTLVQKQIEEHDNESGFEAQYLPLSVYRSQGYDAKFLKWIEQNCKSRLQGDIMTYAYRVQSEASKDRKRTITETMWRPAKEKQVKKRARTSQDQSEISEGDQASDNEEGSQASTSDSSSSASDTRTAKKKQDLKDKKKHQKTQAARKKETKLGHRMVDKIAPTLKSLALAFDRLTPGIRQVMPQYQVMDAEQWLQTLSNLDKKWAMVLKGNSKSACKVDEETTLTALASARACASLFNSSLQIAEASVSQDTPSGKTAKREKREKKVKKSKK